MMVLASFKRSRTLEVQGSDTQSRQRGYRKLKSSHSTAELYKVNVVFCVMAAQVPLNGQCNNVRESDIARVGVYYARRILRKVDHL